MRIAVIGTGYVGLVSGTCFAEFGHEVVCADCDGGRIAALESGAVPFYEPGLDDLVARQTGAGRLRFTADLRAAVAEAEAVLITVGTPEDRRGQAGAADVTFVTQAAAQIAPYLDPRRPVVVVTKSTVPVGTARAVRRVIAQENPAAVFDVCANPEFLREGAAIGDFMRPDRVVIGVDSARAEAVMRALYRPLYLNETPMVVTSIENAEIIKYAANAFLATKVSFINEIADLCERAGGDVQQVAKALGLDGRIGAKFLHAGPGFGGSCFPKDVRALGATAQEYGVDMRIARAVDEINAQRPRRMADKIIAACGGDVRGKRIGVLGLSFKPNTDDLREAPALPIIRALQEAGAVIAAHDPAAMDKAKALLAAIDWCDDAYDAAQGAHALAIVTEWNEYRALDLQRLADSMAERRLIDLRNIYQADEALARGFHYISVGRADRHPVAAARLREVS